MALVERPDREPSKEIPELARNLGPKPVGASVSTAEAGLPTAVLPRAPARGWEASWPVAVRFHEVEVLVRFPCGAHACTSTDMSIYPFTGG